MWQFKKGALSMNLILILAVIVSFLVAIFTAGYNHEPEANKKK